MADINSICLDINRKNSQLICENDIRKYVIGIGWTDYTVHKEAEDVDIIYTDEYGFYKNFSLKEKHTYHVFKSRVRQIVQELKPKQKVELNGVEYSIKRIYIGIPDVIELINNIGHSRKPDFITYKGVDITEVESKLMYVIEVDNNEPKKI